MKWEQGETPIDPEHMGIRGRIITAVWELCKRSRSKKVSAAQIAEYLNEDPKRIQLALHDNKNYTQRLIDAGGYFVEVGKPSKVSD